MIKKIFNIYLFTFLIMCLFSNVEALTYEMIDGPTFNSKMRNLERTVKAIIFTDKPVEAGSNLIEGLDADGDGGVVGWWWPYEGGAEVTISTQVAGQKVQTGTNASSLFSGLIDVEKINVAKLDVSKATTLKSAFMNTGTGKSPYFTLEGTETWNTSNVKSLNKTFWQFANGKTDPIISSIENWNVSNVTDFYGTFAESCQKAEKWSFGDLGRWDTSSATTFDHMFNSAGTSARSFYVGNLGQWNTSKVTRMIKMFMNAWRTPTVWDIGDISNWNTSSVNWNDGVQEMFYGAAQNAVNLKLDLSGWNLNNMNTGMFRDFNAIEIKFPKVKEPFRNTETVTNSVWYDKDDNYKEYAPGRVPALIGVSHTLVKNKPAPVQKTYVLVDGITFNNVMKNLDGNPYQIGTIQFVNTVKPTYGVVEISGLDEDNDGGVVGWYKTRSDGYIDVYISTQKPGQKVVANSDSRRMLDGYESINNWKFKHIQSINVTNLDVSKVVQAEKMFSGVGTEVNGLFEIIGLDGWKTSNMINTSWMFYRTGIKASSWSVGDLSQWEVGNVTNMINMFHESGRHSNVFNLGNLSNWNVSNVTNMSYMFNSAGYDATSWYIGDISSWQVGRVKDMSYMFAGAGHTTKNFSLNLSNWNVSNVNDMASMFYTTGYNATDNFELNLSNWNTSNVYNMNSMFYGTGSSNLKFILNLANWNISYVSNMDYMFYEIGGSEINLPKITNNASTMQITNKTWYDKTNNYKEYIAGSIPRFNDISHTIVRNKPAPVQKTYVLLGNKDRGYETLGQKFQNVERVSGKKIKSIIFTDITKPSVGVIDIPGVDLDGDDGVVGWYENDNNGGVKVYFSSQKRGQKVIAPRDATSLFGDNQGTNNNKDLDFVEYMDVSNLDVSSTYNMASMFYGLGEDSQNVQIVGLETWKTVNVTNFNSMFANFALNSNRETILDLSLFTVDYNATGSLMFSSCGAGKIVLPKLQKNLGDFVTTATWYDETDNYKAYPAGQIPIDPSKNHTIVWEGLAKHEVSNTIEHWIGGFSGDGGKEIHLLERTSFSVPSNFTYTMDHDKNLKRIPNGFYPTKDIQIWGLNGDKWTVLDKPATIHQPNGSLSFQYSYLPKSYKITYQLNGGINNTQNPVGYNVLNGISLKAPTRDGYTFIGWKNMNTNQMVTGINEGKTDTFTNSQEFYNEMDRRTVGEITLQAQWRANQHRITFNPNGGQVSETSRLVNYGSQYGTLPIPTRNNYKFTGWYTDPTYGTKVESNTIMSNNDVTLYAHWEKQIYYVQYVGGMNSMGTMTPETIEFGTNHNLKPNSFSKKGFVFGGWKKR